MISLKTFEKVRKLYGHFASWAVWAEEGDKPKSNIDDLSVLDPESNPDLLNTLTVDFIFLGLNISRRIERPLGNFHDPRPMATDYKIRSALNGTRFWGAYMTDIIKDFEEKAAGRMMKYLSADKGFEKENIKMLKAEIELLGTTSYTLSAFGRDAEKIAKRNLGSEFQIVGIPHYANYMSRADYRSKVITILADVSPKRIAEQAHAADADKPRR